LRIQSLEISGFKSFAERSTLVFDRGVSAIVGPNGCGKSNVVDAVRWVMGEQNPRHLRGRQMADIIFGGTEKVAPSSMAEVVLTLDNSDSTAPGSFAGFSAIQVARRLYRSGESEYLINKVSVRLRDVLDFFLDTGIGVHGYTIVEQGAIAAIVSNKPEERRTIFEEAAGIGKYRLRRRETESKLRSTEQNLTRVNDILGELKRQIGSLDRQARKANRYKKLSAELRDLELATSAQQFAANREESTELERGLEADRSRNVELDASVARVEAAAEEERRVHLDRERELQNAGDVLQALRSEIQALESRLEYERREEQSLATSIEERTAEAQERETQLEGAQRELSTCVEQRAEVERLLEVEREQHAQREAQLRRVQEELAQLRGEREAAREQLQSLSEELARLRARSESLEERANELALRLRENEEALESSSQEALGIEREQNDLERRLQGGLAEQDQLGRSLADLLRLQQDTQVELEEARQALLAARGEQQQVQARLEATREEERRAAAQIDQQLERLDDLARQAIRGRLAESLRVEDGLETALEAVLAKRPITLLVDDSEAAFSLLQALSRADAGRVAALPLTPVESSTEVEGQPLPNPSSPPMGRSLLAAVQTAPELAGAVARLLAGVYVVDRLEDVLQRYPGRVPPGLFVTAAGDILEPGGAITGGSAAPRGTLARGNEIRRLESECERCVESVASAERRAAELAEQLERYRGQAENTRSRRHTAELAVAHLEKDLERARERGKAIRTLSEEQQQDREGLQSELERAHRERERSLAQIEEIGGGRAALELERERLTQETGERAREVEQLEHRLTEARVLLAEQRAKSSTLRDSEKRLRRQLEEGQAWLVRRREEIERSRERVVALKASSEEVTERLRSLLEDEEAARQQQQELRQVFEEGAERIRGQEEELRTATRERESLRQSLAGRELQAQEVRLRLDQLRSRMQERYEIDVASYRIPEALAEADPTEREAELKRLRSALGSLGSVHLGAIEEYEEVTERNRYLSEQKTDLETSVEQLRNAIARINRTSRARFRETFDAINTHFQQLFPKMFRGGRAHLSLTESEDVLEAGIEIHAQPPGKRLQSVGLLSGGEKSLTALALLMAVFSVRPSPFFLLDEVDAALDDANVGRFDALLREMSSLSQFLVITHNKSSIESADRLFGVTMQQPGVSKLVRVDLKS